MNTTIINQARIPNGKNGKHSDKYKVYSYCRIRLQ